jgi:hypothetical protein
MNEQIPFGDVLHKIIGLLDHDTWLTCNNFGGDLNAALKLPIHNDMWWELRTAPNKDYTASAILRHGTKKPPRNIYAAGGIAAHEQASTLVEAVCRAWLSYRTGKQKHPAT